MTVVVVVVLDCYMFVVYEYFVFSVCVCLSFCFQYLDCLWHQILNLKRNNWEEHELIRPYIAFDGTLCDALQHTIPTIMLPSHNDDSVYPLPSVVYHMFDYADVPDVSFLCGFSI